MTELKPPRKLVTELRLTAEQVHQHICVKRDALHRQVASISDEDLAVATRVEIILQIVE